MIKLLMLDQEDHAAGFLSVEMTQTEDGFVVEMKQKGLDDRTLDALGLDSNMGSNS